MKNLGIDDSGVSRLSSHELFAAVQSGQKAVLSNGWEIVAAKVSYEQRIEVRRGSPFSAAEIGILKEQGAFVERINWSQRVFLPVGEDGLAVFERVIASKPVVDLFGPRSPDALGAGHQGQDAVQERRLPSSFTAGQQRFASGFGPVASPPASVTTARRDAEASSGSYPKRIATRLIEQLEAGTAPWQKPWAPGTLHLPHNPVSGTRYRGSNAIWLEVQGREDPRWMTYKQAQSVGAQVRGGEQGTLVQYWKLNDQVPVQDERGKKLKDCEGNPVYRTVPLDRPKVFSAVVFNAEQIEGLPPLQGLSPSGAPGWDRHERAEALLRASGADIRHDQPDRAFYRPATDRIHLPGRNGFKSADAFYACALHELGHWTGHPSRLDRDLAHPFGSEGYAKEELRAEIASLMLGDRLGIGHDPGQHAAYVEGWVKALKEDPREILRAAQDANKISGYVLGLEKDRPAEKIERLQRIEPAPTIRTEVPHRARVGRER